MDRPTSFRASSEAFKLQLNVSSKFSWRHSRAPSFLHAQALVLEFDPATGSSLLYDNPGGVLTNDPQLPVQRKLLQELLALPQASKMMC